MLQQPGDVQGRQRPGKRQRVEKRDRLLESTLNRDTGEFPHPHPRAENKQMSAQPRPGHRHYKKRCWKVKQYFNTVICLFSFSFFLLFCHQKKQKQKKETKIRKHIKKTHPSRGNNLNPNPWLSNHQNVLSQTGFHFQEVGCEGRGTGTETKVPEPPRKAPTTVFCTYCTIHVESVRVLLRSVANLPFTVCCKLGIPYVIGCKSKRFMWT